MINPINYTPAPALTEYIASYEIFEVAENISEPYLSPPIGLSGFIIQTINSSRMVTAKIREEDYFTGEAVATGQVTYPVYGEVIGQVRSILVFFHPMGMYQLFGVDMESLTNKAMNLRDFLGIKLAEKLVSTLKENQDDGYQIKVLNEFFLSISPIIEDNEKLKSALDYIHRHHGDVTVSEIEQNCHFNRKTLDRHFHRKIGLSPKVYTRIYQFKCLINLLKENPGITWTEVSVRAGYFDQLLMSRFLKVRLQDSPANIARLDLELINYLLRN